MNNQDAIRVAIVDDHVLLRDGISVMLREVSDIEVVGTATTGEEIISKLKAIGPDVVIMDIMMKGMTGIEATRWIKERNSEIRVLLLSAEVRREFVSAGIQSGVDGYLTKDVDKSELITAIRKVSRGERYFDSAITSIVFEDLYKKEKAKATKTPSTAGNLSRRELEVLGLVASGKSNNEVSLALNISSKTVNVHKANVRSKLGLKTIAELVKYAIDNNLIESD